LRYLSNDRCRAMPKLRRMARWNDPSCWCVVHRGATNST